MSNPKKPAVGYRFHPTDEELLSHYLNFKILGHDHQVRAIPEVDICKYEPWELPSFSVIESGDSVWYFFSPSPHRQSNSGRITRTTKAGFWKAVGRDRKITARSTNKVIGTKKTLVFYQGRHHPNCVRTNWVMHEYHSATTDSQQTAFVVCCLKKRTEEKADLSNCKQGGKSISVHSNRGNLLAYDKIRRIDSWLETNFIPTRKQSPVGEKQGLSSMDISFVDNYFENSCSGDQIQFDVNKLDYKIVNSVLANDDNAHLKETEGSDCGSNGMLSIQPLESLRRSRTEDDGLSSETDIEVAQARKYQQTLMAEALHEAVSSSKLEKRRRARKFHVDDKFRGLDTSSVESSADMHPGVHSIQLQDRKFSIDTTTCNSQCEQISQHDITQEPAFTRIHGHKVMLLDKAKGAAENIEAVDLPQKESTILKSDKEMKMV